MNLKKFRKDRLKKMLLCAAACVMCSSPAALFAQTGGFTVKGTVTGNGEPLIGVTVAVQGTSSVAVTDLDGNYSITVADENAVLTFSYIGYLKATETVNGRAIINVVLQEDSKVLEEIVVVGYGTQRRSDVTGSIASIGAESLQQVPSSNITTALQGRLPGVEMSQTSTKPGAEMQIRIRGTRSLSASNDPLVVLDGIPFAGSIGDINPNIIKNIDILKDASATAIYGSRGANGVILVTTMRGGLSKAAQVSYNGYVGFKSAIRYPMMDGAEFAQLKAIARVSPYDSYGTDESATTNTDWQDLFYRTGIVNSHDVGIAGATKGGGYNFGLGYYRDEAVIPTQDYNRISLRGTFDQEIGNYFRFGITTTNNYSHSNGNQLGMYNTLALAPTADPFNPDGSRKRVVNVAEGNVYVWTKDVLEENKDTYISQTKAFGSYNNIYGELKIPGIEGLKYRVNLGLNIRTSNGGAFTGEGIGSVNATTESTANISNSLNLNWAIENLLSYDRTFADKHQINVVAMYSAEQTTSNSTYISARDIPNEFFQYYNLGRATGEITMDPDNQDYWQSGLISYMGRAMYAYDNRYMLSATVRSDASSRLAPGHKWHTYPAVSVGWNIKNESFMENVSWLDQLKLRAGYGQTSNQAVKPYATLGLLDTRPYNFGPGGYETGAYVSNLPNPELGWEYSSTWNFGVDFGLWNNRLTGTIEYYTQHTKDILLELGLPPTSGVSGTYMANIGETQNKGFELSLNGIILDNVNGWTWEAGLNLYANRNKLLALASGQLEDKGSLWFVGHPIDVIYDYQYEGLWQTGDPYLNILEPTGNVGMIKVKYAGDYDANGAPTRQINTDDRQIIELEPNFQGGFNTRVAYKGFDLGIVGTFKSGGKLISALHAGGTSYLNMMNGRRGNIEVDYWTPDNTGAKYPDPSGLRSNDVPIYSSTLALFDASYLKIRTITLGYNFHQQWMKTIGVDKLRLYFTVQNPFVLFSPYTNETGLDPETNSFGDQNNATNNYESRLLTVGSNTPSTRNFLFGVNISF